MRLVSIDKGTELKNVAPSTSQPENDEQANFSKMIFQIVGIKNVESAHRYWLQVGFERNTSRNLRVNGSIGFEVVSPNWPNQAIIGRDPSSVGSVNFNYGQKRRWWNGWDTWGSSPFPLNSPDLRNFTPNDQWRARFTGGYDPGATWLYNFF